jgi:hypothetical protein
MDPHNPSCHPQQCKRWRTSSFSNQPLGLEIELLHTGVVINRLSGRGDPSAKVCVQSAQRYRTKIFQDFPGLRP